VLIHVWLRREVGLPQRSVKRGGGARGTVRGSMKPGTIKRSTKG
jgi:hypothetical protein